MIVSATPENVGRAAGLIRAGEVVAFPTETVYGLGADATDARAVARIFEIKERPSFDPLIVHIEAAWWPELVTGIPEDARALAQRFWPGPLTIVLPKTDRIPDVVTAGLPSVAVRVPAHPVARALIEASGRPIAAPSANPFGYVSPTTAAHVEDQIGARVPLILDGGPCRVGIESTVISFLRERPALLRPGGVTLEQIEEIIGPVEPASSPSAPEAPGQLPRHYAPRTALTLVRAVEDIPLAERASAALLLPHPVAGATGFRHVELLAEREDLIQAAANLFGCLRKLDAGGHERIYAVAVPERGLGRAIMDRLRRASRQ
jgi:L-threonylcarbamoyladenylate synthase